MSSSASSGKRTPPLARGGGTGRAAAATRRRAGALAVAFALANPPAGAQPGARIELDAQRAPAIRIAPDAPPAPIEVGRPQLPPLERTPGAGTSESPSVAADDAPYARELEQLRRAASPRTGFGSTRAAADAAWVLGLLDLHGGVGPLAPRQAAVWFRRAADGHRQPLAWAGVAWCAIDGCEGPPDPAAARAAIEKLKPVRPGRALYLQWLLEVAHRPITLAQADARASKAPEQLPEAALLRRAAAAGDTPAQVELGIAAAARGDLAQARREFESAASRSPAARANLKLLDQRHAGSTPTAGTGEAERLFDQAQRAHRGEGVPRNYAEAIRLYQQAAAQGSAPARRMLELIMSRPGPGGAINAGWMAQLAQLDAQSQLPTLDKDRFARLLRRDPTPLFDLIPAPWQQRIAAERR